MSEAQTHHRVVFLDHVARSSGAEIALVRLIEACHDDVRAHVILGEDGPLVEKLRTVGAEVEVISMAPQVRDARKDDMTAGRLPWRSALALARYTLALCHRLRELQPDLVHTNSLKAAIYGGLAGRLAGLPVVWHIHDRIASDYLPRPAVAVVRLMARCVPTWVLANSFTTLSTLPASGHTRVIYNAVPTPRRAEQLPPAEVDPHPFTVGVLGRIAPWKGHDVVLRAFASAFGGGPERLHLIGCALFGEEAYEQELRRLADDLNVSDQLVWRGFQDDVSAELAQLDVLVHASTTPEPFGQVVVEGMHAGLPVIATSVGGPVEIIDDGHDGILVPPQDVSALRTQLLELAGDPERRARLGRAGQDAATRFSPTALHTAIQTLYADPRLARRKPRRRA